MPAKPLCRTCTHWEFVSRRLGTCKHEARQPAYGKLLTHADTGCVLHQAAGKTAGATK